MDELVQLLREFNYRFRKYYHGMVAIVLYDDNSGGLYFDGQIITHFFSYADLLIVLEQHEPPIGLLTVNL